MHCCRQAFKCPFKRLTGWQAAHLQTQRPRNKVTGQNLESHIAPFRSTCPLLISLISVVKLYFPLEESGLKRSCAPAPVDVFEGISMTASQENSSLWLPKAGNRTGLSCIPAHLPTCFSSSGALYLPSVCPPDGIWPGPQRRSHQRASNTWGQTNCKRPSCINGAKVLCFIWTCLALFVCAPHSLVLGEILSTVFFPPALNMQLIGAGIYNYLFLPSNLVFCFSAIPADNIFTSLQRGLALKL